VHIGASRVQFLCVLLHGISEGVRVQAENLEVVLEEMPV
jgi:hypothetical protein